MPLFEKSHLMFIHIPKTGGSSVEKMLYEKEKNIKYFTGYINKRRIRHGKGGLKCPPQHLTLNEVNCMKIPFRYSMAIVRNPFKKVISCWKYQNERPFEFICVSGKYKIHKDFDQWLNNLYNHFKKGNLGYVRHNIPQYKFICGKSEKININVLYHLENLTTILGMQLPHVNKTKSSEHILTPQQVNKIIEIYKKDFEILGYSKNPKDMDKEPLKRSIYKNFAKV